MSDDLVNQITLNFLISKQQLHKLNKHIKQKETDTLKVDKDIYRDQINELFTKMMNDDFPDDLLQDVRNSFSYFIDKSIYYLKLQTQNNNLIEENPKVEEEDPTEDLSLEEDEEEDYPKGEDDEEGEEDEEEDEEEEEEEEEEEILKPQKVFKKTNKTVHSTGVDDIHQLPLDWFTKVRYNYKQNQIIQGKKDDKTNNRKDVILSPNSNYKNSEKKNLTNLYEDKKNTK